MIFGVSDFATTDPFFNAETIVESGMDFIEAGCARLVALPEQDFQSRAKELASKEIRVQSLNWFLPPELKIVGDEVADEKSRKFLNTAISRAAALGAKAIVFGSPASRSIPDGFSTTRAREQLTGFCHLCADVIRDQNADIKLAVEHVNHTETNFINTFAEALEIAREVSRPEVGVAADLYHFYMENESSRIIREAGDLVCAVQLADPRDRSFPKPDSEVPGLKEFFQNLRAISYTGGISVEATPGADLRRECRLAAQALRENYSSM